MTVRLNIKKLWIKPTNAIWHLIESEKVLKLAQRKKSKSNIGNVFKKTEMSYINRRSIRLQEVFLILLINAFRKGGGALL